MEKQKLKFGSVLNGIRTSRELTIRDFSEATGFSAGYLCDLENSNRMGSLEVINKISNKICTSEEENKAMVKAYMCDRLTLPSELIYYLVENELLESIKIIKEHDPKGESIKKLAKSIIEINMSK